MFGDLLVIIIEIFVEAPSAFIDVTNNLVAYINKHNLIPIVFVIGLSIVGIRQFIENDMFDMVASILKLVVICIVSYALVQKWSAIVPGTGLSISNELIGIVIDDEDGEKLDGACNSEINTSSSDPNIRKEVERSAQGACYIGNKLQKAIDNLTTPLTTSIDVPDEVQDNTNPPQYGEVPE
jgi:hypothetical protein